MTALMPLGPASRATRSRSRAFTRAHERAFGGSGLSSAQEEWIRLLDWSPLRTVIPVEAEQAQEGLWVEVPWIEVRDTGFRVAVHVRTDVRPAGHYQGPAGRLGPIVAFKFADPPPFGPMPIVRVEDDVRTDYRAGGGSGSGDWPSSVRYDHQFVPAPPANARRLTVVVERLATHAWPGEKPSPPIVGPWRFDIDLTRDALGA